MLLASAGLPLRSLPTLAIRLLPRGFVDYWEEDIHYIVHGFHPLYVRIDLSGVKKWSNFAPSENIPTVCEQIVSYPASA